MSVLSRARHRRWLRGCLRSASLGSVVWIAWIFWRDPDAITMLLALAALVIHPLVLRLPWVHDRQAPVSRRLAIGAHLPSAAAFALALGSTPGPLAGVLAVPWLFVTALTAHAGLMRARRRGRRQPLEEVVIDLGHVLLVIGGGWAVLSCAGARPLSLSAAVVLVTAIHFHYAGFVLPVLAGMAGRCVEHSAYRLVPAGIIAGVPLVAVGIIASPWIEVVAAMLLAAAGLGLAIAQLALAVRAERRVVSLLLALSGLSLGHGMVLATVYGITVFRGDPWPAIPDMAYIHGTTNALGCCLLGAWAWTLASPAERPTTQPETRTHG